MAEIKNYIVLALIQFVLQTTFVQADPFEKVALKFINYYRQQHGAPPLTVDPELTNLATKCAAEYTDDSQGLNEFSADDARILSTNRFSYPCSDTRDGNELVLLADPGNNLGSYVTTIVSWANEDYDFDFPDYETIEECERQTQLLWKSTTNVGCACDKTNVTLSVDGAIKNVCSCIFYPPGNIRNGFGANGLASYVLNLQAIGVPVSRDEI